MEGGMIIPTVCLAILCGVLSVSAQCSFEEAIRGNYYMDIQSQDFLTITETELKQTLKGNLGQSTTCKALDIQDKDIKIAWQLNLLISYGFCDAIKAGQNSKAFLDTRTRSAAGQEATLELCNDPYTQVLILLPLSNAETATVKSFLAGSSVDSTIQQGTYQTEAITTSGTKCSGDASSTVTINSDTITFNLCDNPFNNNTLEFTTLNWVDHWPGDDEGHVALLADTSGSDQANVYCARYTVKQENGKDEVYISMEVVKPGMAECKVDQTASTPQQDVIVIKLTKDICDSSTCENNGTCEVENGAPKCSCVAGFSGDRCENNDEGQFGPPDEEDNIKNLRTIMVILLCVAAAVIFLAVITALVICNCCNPKSPEERSIIEYESASMRGNSWKAGYLNPPFVTGEVGEVGEGSSR